MFNDNESVTLWQVLLTPGQHVDPLILSLVHQWYLMVARNSCDGRTIRGTGFVELQIRYE
jgi:hypothetical protein